MRYGEFKDMACILAPEALERDLFLSWLILEKLPICSDRFAVYQKMRSQCAVSRKVNWFTRRKYSFKFWYAQIEWVTQRWYFAWQIVYKKGAYC